MDREHCINEGCGMPYFHCDCGIYGKQFKSNLDFKMKTQIENPKGLHARYVIKKLVVEKNPRYQAPPSTFPKSGTRINPEYRIKEVNTDKNAEYFVLRLDEKGSDLEHIKACRIGVHAYAKAIEHHLPELAKDLIERYPLIV